MKKLNNLILINDIDKIEIFCYNINKRIKGELEMKIADLTALVNEGDLEKQIVLANGAVLNVKQYLPIEKKYDLIQGAVTKSRSNGVVDPVQLEHFFNVFVAVMYTDIDFMESELTSGQMYDVLTLSGVLQQIIDNIPKEEYDSLFNLLDDTVTLDLKVATSFAGFVNTVIPNLPEYATAFVKALNDFDVSKYQNVVKFAEAANGSRPIE